LFKYNSVRGHFKDHFQIRFELIKRLDRGAITQYARLLKDITE